MEKPRIGPTGANRTVPNSRKAAFPRAAVARVGEQQRGKSPTRPVAAASTMLPMVSDKSSATRTERHRQERLVLVERLMVIGGWCLVALLPASIPAACGDASSASSSDASAVRRVAAKSHLVAVSYRAFGAAEQNCRDEFNAGVLNTDVAGASCIDDGLTGSKLEDSIEALRTQIVAVARNGSAECKAVAQRLAGLVKEEQGSIHALRGDLENLDGRSFNRDFEHAGATAGRESGLIDGFVEACL